jgi:colanic acid/amylovoran biosynthesis glycosyltransferase
MTLPAAIPNPIRVLHSYPNWLPQTQTWMYTQVRALPGAIEPHIVCETTQNLDQFSLPNIHSLQQASRGQRLWDKGLRKLKLRRHLGFGIRIARQTSAQILHSHFGQIGWADLGWSRRAHLKHVVTFYGQDVNYLPQQDARWYARYRRLFAQVDRILCEGPHMAHCLRQLGCPADKIRVHHLGVPIASIAFQPRHWQPGEPLRILIAAAFREKKGIPDALAVLGKLQHQVDLAITLIGDANAEPRCQAEKHRILAALENYGLQGCTRLLGYQPHTVFFDEAYRHHIFLSPSKTASDGDTEGGAPVSLIEVAATGMPIVSTQHCDIPEVIEPGVTGLLAPEGDVDGLWQHLSWLIQHPSAWSAMLQAGRHRMEHEFDAQVQAEKLAAFYAELI